MKIADKENQIALEILKEIEVEEKVEKLHCELDVLMWLERKLTDDERARFAEIKLEIAKLCEPYLFLTVRHHDESNLDIDYLMLRKDRYNIPLGIFHEDKNEMKSLIDKLNIESSVNKIEYIHIINMQQKYI